LVPVTGRWCPEVGEITVGQAPQGPYASQTSVVYQPIRAHGLRKGDEHLAYTLITGSLRATVDDRSFARAACPMIWNGLPVDVTAATSLLTFRRKLKAFISTILPGHYFVTVSVVCRSGPCSVLLRERQCADTIGAVLVPWAGHFQCENINIFSNKIYGNNFIKQHWETVMV